jgi:FMN reductase [NAD(P)H]
MFSPVAMDFQSFVRRRRMVRHLTTEPVPRKTIDNILELAQHAPSAGFSQGSAYVVVTDAEVKRRVARLHGEEDYTDGGFHGWITEAHVAIVACVSEKLYHDRHNEPDKLDEQGKEIDWPTPYRYFDMGAGCMVIPLVAVDAGLAAAFTGVPDVKGTRGLLGIPSHFHPVGVISFGRGDNEMKFPSLKHGRRKLAETVHYEKW